jgi:UDP-N-acetyl-D-mannosaminuronate dehydrogenase
MAKVLQATSVPTGPKLGTKQDLALSEKHLSWASLSSYDEPDVITPPYSDEDTDESLPDTISAADEPIVAVLGVGYVGTHLVSSFSSQYSVIGFDVSSERIKQMNQTNPCEDKIHFTSDPCEMRRATHFLISVPTLLRQDRTVDSSYLQSAIKTVGTYARQGATVVVESSVAVGMTRKLLGPLAVARGFFAGMSPEVCC